MGSTKMSALCQQQRAAFFMTESCKDEVENPDADNSSREATLNLILIKCLKPNVRFGSLTDIEVS
jgi:hypothetical protein